MLRWEGPAHSLRRADDDQCTRFSEDQTKYVIANMNSKIAVLIFMCSEHLYLEGYDEDNIIISQAILHGKRKRNALKCIIWFLAKLFIKDISKNTLF